MLATAALATVQVARRAQFQRSSSVGIPGARCQEEDVTRVASDDIVRQAAGVTTITGSWGTVLARLALVLGWFQVGMRGNQSRRDTTIALGSPLLARLNHVGMDNRVNWDMGITKAV